MVMMDRVTVLLAAARFAAAVARLSLGPLLPLLTLQLGFHKSDRPALLSAYSSGYILTQIGGGFMADRYGAPNIIAASVATSSLFLGLLALTSSSSSLLSGSLITTATVAAAAPSSSSSLAELWTRAFFGLGLVAGPLFPAGSTAISSGVPSERRAAAAAIVDAAAAAGTTVAALAPMIADLLGWRFVFLVTATGLACVAMGSLSLKKHHRHHHHHNNKTKKSKQEEEKEGAPQQKQKQKQQNDYHTTKDLPSFSNTSSSSSSSSSTTTTTMQHKYPVAALLSPSALCTYLCHSADNFTKYSVNAWASTMLAEQYGASPSLVGSILATQEAVGVASRLLVGTCYSGVSSTTPARRGSTSCLAFGVQGLALWAAFRAPNLYVAGVMMIISAIAVGAHSIGFRPLYFEASPEHAGAISGFGNTVASMASAVGPVVIGSVVGGGGGFGWWRVGLVLSLVNLGGAMAAMTLMRVGMSKRRMKTLYE